MAKKRRLVTYVHVHNFEDGSTEIYGPDDDVPADAAEKITNPFAWEQDKASPKASPLDGTDDEVASFVSGSTVSKVLEAVKAYDADLRAEVASHVLTLENDRDKPRKSLVDELEGIAAGV